MANFHAGSKPKKTKDIVFQSMPPETILLNLDNGFYYSTNRIGSMIWERCDGERSVSDIAEDIAGQFGIPKQEAEQDVVAFMRDMLGEGLISVE